MQDLVREMIVERAGFAFNTVDLVKDPENVRAGIKAKAVWENLRRWRFPTDRIASKRSGFLQQNKTECSSVTIGNLVTVNSWSGFSGKLCDITNSFGYNANWNLILKVINIETAVLFMEIPKGVEKCKKEYFILKRTIYGLVQSVREFYKNLFCP
jgi:hypothetical protein